MLYVNVFASVASADDQEISYLVQKQGQKIAALKNKIDEVEALLRMQQDALYKAGVIKRGLGQGQVVPVLVSKVSGGVEESSNADTNKPTEEVSLGAEREDYDLALVALKNEQFVDAEKRLMNFMSRYPNSALHSNASFWYAESFYRRGDFNKAAVNYLQSYKKFPNSEKAPDALLKLSYSLFNLDRGKDACDMLAKMHNSFPDMSPELKEKLRTASAKFTCN